jgi:hypothetical protein
MVDIQSSPTNTNKERIFKKFDLRAFEEGLAKMTEAEIF